MADDVEAFHTDVMQEVVAAATARGEFSRTTFVENLASRLVEGEILQDWTPCYFDGKGHRNRALALDGYSLDELELDGTLQILIADHRESRSIEALNTAEVNAAFGRSTAFVADAISGRLHDELEPSTPAADLAQLIHGSKGALRTVRVLVLSNARLGTRYKEVQRSKIDGLKLELHVWDLVRLQQLAATGGREELDLDVSALVPGGLPALPASIGGTQYKAFLCVVPGTFLADIYEEHGSRLLEGNVRAFLSTRGNVNKGIRKTLSNHPDRFFAFNNGITATAKSIETDSEGNLVRIRDLQIVNGGQTTASIYNARARDSVILDGVFVQMKLSVLDPEVARTMIPDISRYANTQNKVSDADLFANHPFHRKVEDISRRLWAPPRAGSQQMTHWFYERARAQYMTEQFRLTPAEKKAFLLQNPKGQLITKTDLAKYENTWRRLPHVVSLGAQKNFVKYAEVVREEYDRDPASFNERWYQHLAAKAILFSSTETIVSNAAWYANAYRANIVTYAIARMLTLIDETFPGRMLDLDQLWRSQRLPDVVATQLGAASEVAFHVLVEPPPEWSNVTEWAKKEMCWRRVSAAPVAVTRGLEKYLRTAEQE